MSENHWSLRHPLPALAHNKLNAARSRVAVYTPLTRPLVNALVFQRAHVNREESEMFLASSRIAPVCVISTSL